MDNLDEDEDVIFEGSQLHAHLTSANYSGPEIEFISNHKKSVSKTIEHHPQEKSLYKKCCSVIFSTLGLKQEDHVVEFSHEVTQYIACSNLVSLEDSDFLANIFEGKFNDSHVDDKPSHSFSVTSLGGITLAILLISTPAIPWYFRIPSLLYTGVNMIRESVKKLNQKKQDELMKIVKQFKTSLDLLQILCSTMSKSMQFIQEMELIDRGFTLPNLVSHLSMKTVPNQTSALLCLPFRQELLDTVQQLHILARDRTLLIRETVPLDGVMDNSSHYLACQTLSEPSFDDNQPITLQLIRASIRQCNNQLSEMLRRLALSFLNPTADQLSSLRLLIDTFSREMSSHVSTLTFKMKSAYEYYTAWKVIDKEMPSSDVFRERSAGLEVALHSLERHLRAAALVIEEFKADQLVGLSKLGHECQAISTCYELIDFEVKKSVESPPFTEIRLGHSERIETIQLPDEKEILPLYGAWEPNIQDEILEADLQLEHAVQDNSGDDDFDWNVSREEMLVRRKERAAQSKRLYSELQVVLRSKADEWKEREAKVMERLGKKIEEAAEVADISTPEAVAEDPAVPALPLKKFDVERAAVCLSVSNFSAQAALAAQVRALAAQRTLQREDDIFADSSDSSDGEDGVHSS